MIDFKFKVCYDFTGVTEEEIERFSEYDLMLNPCIRYVRVLLERPLETVYLYKVSHTSTEEYFNDRFDKERMPNRNVGYVRFVEVSFKGPHWECRTLTWEPTEDYVPFPKDALTDGKQFVHNNKKIVVV